MELVVYIAAARNACHYLPSFHNAGEKDKILSLTTEELNEPPIEYDEVEETDNNIEDFSEQEIDEELDKVANEVSDNSNVQIDKQTGEILRQTEDKQNNDKELVNKLNSLLEGKLEVKL